MGSPPALTVNAALTRYLAANPPPPKRAAQTATYCKALRRLVGALPLEEALKRAPTWRRDRMQAVAQSTATGEAAILRRVLEAAGYRVAPPPVQPLPVQPHQHQHGGPCTPPGKPGTLQEAIHRWELVTLTRGRAKQFHAAYWVRLWGQRPLAEITADDVQAWQAESLRAGLVKPGTLDVRQAFLSSVFERARREGLVGSNPCRAAGWIRVANGRTRVLSDEEEASLLPALHPDLAALIRFLLATGLRAGEALALEWKDVQEDRAWIAPMKTPNGRHIPLNATALALLAARREHPRPWPYSYRQVAQQLERVCKKLGLEGVTLHVMRHTFATRLLRSGASLLHVKRCLGHSDWKNTERYSHLVLDDLQEAVGRLDRAPAPPTALAELAALVAQLTAQVAALTARLA